MALLGEHEEHIEREGYYVISQWYLHHFEGTWSVEVCDGCNNILHIRCQHEKCVWNESNTILNCVACGEDCT